MQRADEPRHELKYFVNGGDARALCMTLAHVLRRDPNGDENNEYAVRSLYFDDVYDTAYYDKISGVMHRDKYRIRIYKYSDARIYMERKRKMGDRIQKTSVPITRRLAEQIIACDPTGMEKAKNPLIQDLYGLMRTRLLRPTVIVDYVREAYTHPAERVRVTFDRQLRTGLYSKDLFDPRIAVAPPLTDGREILEVKYNSYLPDYIAGLLAETPSERSAISKYTLCRRFEPL